MSDVSLADVMEQHPQLTLDGIGLVRLPGERGGVREDRFAAGRAELARRGAKVSELVAWLRDNFTSIETPSQGSYQLKELAKPQLGYVSNGELIAAAFIVGYPYHRDGVNVLFGVSALDVRRLKAERRKGRS